MSNLRLAASRPSLALALVLGVSCGLIYQPGMMSVDSLWFYQSALNSQFSDAHGLLLPVLLASWFKIGGSLAQFTVLQCLLGFLGIRRLARAASGFFGLTSAGQELAASLVLVLLASPLSLAPVYFATLWTDTWLVIFLLWAAALLFELSSGFRSPAARARLAVLVVVMALALIVRRNTWVLYLPFAVLLSVILINSSWKRGLRLALTAAPLALALLLVLGQYAFMNVQAVNETRMIYALDLTSMLANNPRICGTLPLTACAVVDQKLSPDFIPGRGAIDQVWSNNTQPPDLAYATLVVSPTLEPELLQAALRFPGTYLTVKALNFWDYIRPRERFYYYQSYIHPNGHGLWLNPRFAGLRERWFTLLHKVYTHPVLKWFSFVHLPWLVLALLGAASGLLRNQFASEHQRFLARLLLIPLVYSLSYLLWLPVAEFRFMVPSMLVMQVIVLPLAGSAAYRVTRQRNIRNATGPLAIPSKLPGNPHQGSTAPTPHG